MAIYSYKNKAGVTLWRVVYRKPDHSQGQKRGFERKRDAQEWLAGVEVSKARGEFINRQDGKVTVSELGSTWLASQTHLKASSFKAQEVGYRVHVLPKWGNSPIAAIRHSKVQEWVSDLSKDKSATTVIRAYGVLAAILDVAVRDRRILENPARGVKLPKKTKKPHAYLTRDQIDALADATGPHATLIYLLAYTGLRWGEATALRVKDIDFLRGRISVTENAVTVGGSIIVGTPKTYGYRTVSIFSTLIPRLSIECQGKTRDQLVFGDGVNHLRQSTSRRGWLDAAVSKCQEVDAEFPRITAHDLRHTAASLAVSAGANVKVLQKMLGHASAAMTLDTYADLFDDDLDNVSEALEKSLSQKNVANMLPREAQG